eukprot:766514-Pleurochrysis_carterae.AAC.3
MDPLLVAFLALLLPQLRSCCDTWVQQNLSWRRSHNSYYRRPFVQNACRAMWYTINTQKPMGSPTFYASTAQPFSLPLFSQDME